MPHTNRETGIDETDAKAGSNEGVVRWVLLFSLLLAIIAMTVIWVTGALTQDKVETIAHRIPPRSANSAAVEAKATSIIPACPLVTAASAKRAARMPVSGSASASPRKRGTP